MRTNLPIAVACDLSCLSDDRGHDNKFVISCAVDRWKAVFLGDNIAALKLPGS